MSGIDWTEEQLGVIDSVDSDTLVSASAGSGKTAVMLERIIRLIVGDETKGRAPVPLKRIVIVTFNESVAAELKGKLNSRLTNMMSSGVCDRDYLRRQIEDLPLADISTLHSFCGALIKSNFEYLGVKPSYSIIDEEEKQVLFGKAIKNALKKYKTDFAPDVEVLIDYFKGEESFAQTLSKINAFLEAQLDRDEFLSEIAQSSYVCDFSSSQLAKAWIALFHSDCIDFIAEGNKRREYFISAGMDKRAEHISLTLAYLEELLAAADVEQLCLTLAKMPLIPNVPAAKKNDDVDKSVSEDYKTFNDSFKTFIKGIAAKFANGYGEEIKRLEENKPYLVRLLQIVDDVSKEYASLKRKDNKMDFADLEYYAVKLMRDDAIAADISSAYDYICIDEYQDVNAVQEYILGRLSNGRNLFMVGDVKQSIYQFRMTDPDIFLSKYRSFRLDGRLGSAHVLNKNYRSCKEVIDFVNAVFDVIMTEDNGGVDYRRESRLAQGNKTYMPQDDGAVRLAFFGRGAKDCKVPLGEDKVYSVRDSGLYEDGAVYDEGVYIADKIASLVGKNLIQDGDGSRREVRFSDIAILCTKRSDGVQKIIDTLRSAGIPVDSGNIVREKSNSGVGLLLDFIRLLDNPRRDIPLASTLTSRVFADLTYSDLAAVKKAYRAEKFFHNAIVRYMREKADSISGKLQLFWNVLEKYRFASGFMRVSDLMRRIIADFDMRDYLLTLDRGNDEYAGLLQFIGQLEDKAYNSDIYAFVDAADNTADFGKVSGDVGMQGDFVKTNTVHASKGLEYPIVFLVDAAKQINADDIVKSPIIMDKKYGFAIKSVNASERVYEESLPMALIKDIKSKKLVEEYMRLFYVAVTRARNRLYITGTSKSEFAKKSVAKPKSIWDWLNNVAVRDEGFKDKYLDSGECCANGDSPQLNSITFRRADKERVEFFRSIIKGDYAYFDATRTLVKHTVTNVAKSFYQSEYGDRDLKYSDSESMVENLKDGQREGQEELLSYADEGIAYHRALECIDYDCYTVKDVENSLDRMVEQGMLTTKQRDFVSAQSLLECLQSDVMRQALKYPHYREKQFMLDLPADEIYPTSVKDRVLLQGTIDLFIRGREKDGENILVDFKYSRKSEKEVERRYRRQLELYSMAVEECTGEKVDRKIIFLLGRNKTIEL